MLRDDSVFSLTDRELPLHILSRVWEGQVLTVQNRVHPVEVMKKESSRGCIMAVACDKTLTYQ